MSSTAPDLESQLIEEIGEFTHDPLGFVNFAYDWGEGELAESQGPREWQADVLREIGEHLANSETRHIPLLIAIASGHGIGKSALVGMIIHWALSTCEETRVLVTANTGDQLDGKTVPEAKKWFRRAINTHWFICRSETFKIAEPKFADTWRADFETWNLERTEAFAGLHNKGKRIIVIFDEASSVPDQIWEVTEGALTDEETEIIWLAFGNPTKNTGRFRECFGRYKHRWQTKQIDSRTVAGTNHELFSKWIEDWGEDSDFVRIRVRGEFPKAGSAQFIDSETVAAARKYKANGYESLPKVLSVDVARFGDDQTVIGWRQGRKAVILQKLRGKDADWVANRMCTLIDELKPDATVVDEDGVGGPVLDFIRARGYTRGVFGFHGGAEPQDQKYFNKRAEAWGLMRDWLAGGAEIPDDPELDAHLTGVEYGFAKGKRNYGSIQLEEKDSMKARGLDSPDCADMLAMTFGVPLAIRPPKVEPELIFSSNQTLQWMG